MQYSSKTAEFAPADFLLQIIGLKIDYNQLLLAKLELFLDCFSVDFDGFSDHFTVFENGKYYEIDNLFGRAEAQTTSTWLYESSIQFLY